MKYIVYQTTSKVNNKIYIGVHKTENPDVFDGYLGNEVYIYRPSSYMHPKTHFQFWDIYSRFWEFVFGSLQTIDFTVFSTSQIFSQK